tara:strand:- start:324 stop:482 length:159 start_codon:yes stop_codon:yes gene_type:complete
MAKKIKLERNLVMALEPEYYNLPRKKKKDAKKIITLVVLESILEYMKVCEYK